MNVLGGAMTEGNEMRVAMIFVNSPKKTTRYVSQELLLLTTSLPRLLHKLNLNPPKIVTWSSGG